jgi:hypothetical protein
MLCAKWAADDAALRMMPNAEVGDEKKKENLFFVSLWVWENKLRFSPKRKREEDAILM